MLGVVEAQTPRSPRRAVWALAAAAALGGAVFVGWQQRTSDTVTFSVGPNAAPGKLGAYYAAPASVPLPLHFSDGSELSLAPGARTRVSEASTRKKEVLLEAGTANVHVVHQTGSTWYMSAGPYTVEVVGTAFSLSWEPAVQRMVLQMRSGAVVVRGPNIGERQVRGNELFVASAGSTAVSGQAAPEASSAAAGDTKRAPAPSPAESANAAASATAATTASSAAAEPKRDTSWAALNARGAYQDVLDAAEKRGIDSTLSGASAQDLRALADAARFNGSSSLAQRALLSLRSRFRGTPSATSAAFLLGRLADDGGNAQSALTYYDQYLAEGGSLAPEASGRRMLVLQRLGDRTRARKAALDYLRRFPKGPYAAQAKNLTR